jgi:S1-C subfamily serine protease
MQDSGSGKTAGPDRTPGRAARIAACLAAGALALGVGFGVARLAGAPGAPAVSSAIPSPNGTDEFVEDDNLTAQDNQTNILTTTAPGLVHIVSGGSAAGIGMVLTPSGQVLTTYLPGSRAGLQVRYVVSGAAFKATVIGVDRAAGLALLQLQGGGDRPFSTVRVGNSATITQSAAAARQFSYHVAGQVVDTAVGTTGTRDALTIDIGNLVALDQTATVDGAVRTGLLRSTLQSAPSSEIGGPLVDLTGRVIGITVAASGHGLDVSGYAMPVNQALAVARQIDRRAGRAS